MLTNTLLGQFRKKFGCSITTVLFASITLWAMNAMASAQGKIPELMSRNVGWISAGPFLDPPAGMRGPIRQHPAHPFHGNLDGPGQVTPAIGNWGTRCSSLGPPRK